jgi:hypothetical protein
MLRGINLARHKEQEEVNSERRGRIRLKLKNR